MKDIKAKLERVIRVRVSGDHTVNGYDDNVIRLRLRITEGPQAFVDRYLTAGISVERLTDELSAPVARRLLDALSERLELPIIERIYEDRGPPPAPSTEPNP